MASAEIDFGGVKKRCQMACVPEATEGDYVLVHAGVALTVIDRVEAERVLAALAEMDDFELRASGPT
jgi:hydrogenase expression/formation protein HypC